MKLKSLIIKRYRGIKLKFDWNIVYPFRHKFYWFLIKHMQWWPITFGNNNLKINSNGKKRIAYYLWEYPALSQTFVQREINALRNSLGEVFVFSDVTSSDYIEDIIPGKPTCLLPVDKKKLQVYKKLFFKKNPFLFVNLFFYTLLHNYHPYKSLSFDKETFNKSVYLAGLMRENNISHIHSPWSDRSAFVSLIASKLLNISYSVQARAHDIHRKNYLFGLEEKFNNADFIITNTNYNLEHLGKNYSLNGKVNLIYNGIDLKQFVPVNGENQDPGPVKLLCVARLVEQKGLIILLKAVKILKDKNYEFTCEIIGGPESLYMNYYISLKKLHKELELSENVFFLEAQPFDKVLKHYNESDIFVLPCVVAEDGSRDITPNSLIEAMAMKLPVISTTVTGIPEIVDNGINGILIPPNDIDALVNAVEKLFNEPLLRRQFGENARRKVEERFDINKNINRYIHLFENNLKN